MSKRRTSDEIYNDLKSGKTSLISCKQYIYLFRKKKDLDAVVDYIRAMEKFKMGL